MKHSCWVLSIRLFTFKCQARLVFAIEVSIKNKKPISEHVHDSRSILSFRGVVESVTPEPEVAESRGSNIGEESGARIELVDNE